MLGPYEKSPLRPTSTRRFSCPTAMHAPPSAADCSSSSGTAPAVLNPHIAKAIGISRKCARKWISRYATEGEPRLRVRSSRARTSPQRANRDVEHRIIELRCRQRRGPDWIAAERGVAARTVSRVLARQGVPRLCTLDPIIGETIRSSKATAVGYERDRPASWCTWMSRRSAAYWTEVTARSRTQHRLDYA